MKYLIKSDVSVFAWSL